MAKAMLAPEFVRRRKVLNFLLRGDFIGALQKMTEATCVRWRDWLSLYGDGKPSPRPRI